MQYELYKYHSSKLVTYLHQILSQTPTVSDTRDTVLHSSTAQCHTMHNISHRTSLTHVPSGLDRVSPKLIGIVSERPD